MDPIEQASEEILRVLMAEHWARFYYAMEQDGVVYLSVPPEVVEALKATHPSLAEFVTDINKAEFVNAVKPVWDKFAPTPELKKLVQDIVNAK